MLTESCYSRTQAPPVYNTVLALQGVSAALLPEHGLADSLKAAGSTLSYLQLVCLLRGLPGPVVSNISSTAWNAICISVAP